MSRPLRLIVALACLLALTGSSAARASQTQTLIFDAQRELSDPSTRDRALDEIQSLGVSHMRVVLYWKDVAPQADSATRPSVDLTDPASYDWSRYDGELAALRARGITVLMTLTTPGPKWAMSGHKDYVTRPSATLYGRFVTAAARHYGDQVNEWAVINEPNHPDFLGPQYSSKRHTPLSPKIYRGLFQAADKALKATGNGNDTLLIGETAPRGTSHVVAPLTFLRGVLCLNSRYHKSSTCGKLDADGWAHHAYTTKSGPFFVPPGKNDVTIGVVGRLVSALDKAGRAGAIRRHMPIWLTEFGIQSSPDRFFGVSLAQQPEYRAISERLAWGNSRVKAFSQYLLRDDLPRDGVPASARYGGFESGLRFAAGGAKPSLVGFKLPLAALRRHGKVTIWGMVRTAPGPVQAEVRYQPAGSRSFKRLKTVTTNARGYFTFGTANIKGRRYRLVYDGVDSPAVRAYDFP